MNWITLTALEQLDQIIKESATQPVLIFKHSTRCNISRTALDRLERSSKPEELAQAKVYYLDLLSYREISQAIAHKFGVQHESPQAIVIKQGEAVYSASHFEISYTDILKQLN